MTFKTKSELLTTPQVAELFGTTRKTIGDWRRRGMPFHWYGPKKLRYDKEAVEQWFRREILPMRDPLTGETIMRWR